MKAFIGIGKVKEYISILQYMSVLQSCPNSVVFLISCNTPSSRKTTVLNISREQITAGILTPQTSWAKAMFQNLHNYIPPSVLP